MNLFERLNPHRRFFLLAFDTILAGIVFLLSYFIIGEGHIQAAQFHVLWGGCLVMVLVRFIVFASSNLDRGIMRYASIEDLKAIFRAVSTGTLFAYGIFFLFHLLKWIPYHDEFIAQTQTLKFVLAVDYVFNVLFIGGSRFLVRAFRSYQPTANPDLTRVLIVGAGDSGESILREIHFNPRSNYEVVGLLDDDPAKQHKQIHGVLVLGTTNDLASVFETYDVDQVFIAIPKATPELIRRIVDQCREYQVTFRKLPGVRQMIDGRVTVSQLKEVQLEDLLGREPVQLDLPSIGRFITDRVVVITGAAGSIGSELCRQVLSFDPEQLICLDHSENGLYALMQEFHGRSDTRRIEPVVGSITDKERMRWVFDTFKPTVIFHAAAHKHVPMMERNRSEAVYNNIYGTRVLVELADEYRVDKFVMISTDKAVNPTSTMGVCKRVAELIVRDRNRRSSTQFMTVRFGNVLGSAGSVVPLFKRQIADGGPITITHPDIERYFMTIYEAVQLVIQAAAMGEGGEIFVLEMGTPMKIIDLARNLITLSGLQQGVDIDIEIVGLRPGEKMTEELWVTDEDLIPTDHRKINVAVPSAESFNGDLLLHIDNLLGHVNQVSNDSLVDLLREIVPSYSPVKGDNKRF